MTAFRTDKDKGRNNIKYTLEVVQSWREMMRTEKISLHQLALKVGASDTAMRRAFERYNV